MSDKKQRKQPGHNGFKYRQQYGVIIICDGEHHQQTVYENLAKQGFKLKVVTV